MIYNMCSEDEIVQSKLHFFSFFYWRKLDISVEIFLSNTNI